MLWFFNQAFRWRPVSRSAKVEDLPVDSNLPGLDIFVCTIDPEKEPTIDVMETIISAIAMDYPANKLAVYLSDDGGCPVTLYGIKEASEFAKVWVPFCNKYGIKSRTPRVFFSSMGKEEQFIRTHEFRAEQEEIKAKYKEMQNNIEKFGSEPQNIGIVNDRPARIEFRVSGILSNGPYVLVVDCDMFCNDPSSAKQAMCFFLDPQTSNYISFVQFPQMFYNLSKKDIYDNQSRSAFKTMWQGMDGLRGPGLAGSGNYLNRSSLLFGGPNQKDDYLLDALNYFGKSTMFIESLKTIRGHKTTKKNIPRDEILREAQVTDPWFAVFAFLYVATQIQHLIEVLSGGGSVTMWWNEQRIWILKSVTSIFAIIEAMKKGLGLKKKKISLSNKALDKESVKKYEQGRFNFQGAALYMSPMFVLLIVNIVCFFGGLWRVLKVKDYVEMFGQLFLLSYIIVLSYPIVEAIVTMKSN
ncbi:hypothetical protein TanjilG_25260 [Lupinus angustifolius]|uniref:Uncharacterized protein n=1 Tax=Lupinus angustifolius TaxID=3871 RepID=A0A4P1RV42_LUPAN|nr:hypothetical protein TanjilG_25260 [Lupinus angustifolius]